MYPAPHGRGLRAQMRPRLRCRASPVREPPSALPGSIWITKPIAPEPRHTAYACPRASCRVSGGVVPDQLLRGGDGRGRGVRRGRPRPGRRRAPRSAARRAPAHTGGGAAHPRALRPRLQRGARCATATTCPAWIHPADRDMLADPLKGLSAAGRGVLRRAADAARAARGPGPRRRRRPRARRAHAARRPHPRPHPGLRDVQHPHRRGRRGDLRRRHAVRRVDRPHRPARRRSPRRCWRACATRC